MREIQEQRTSLARQVPEDAVPGMIILSGQAGIDPGPVVDLLERAGLKSPATLGPGSPLQSDQVSLHACDSLENGCWQLLDHPGAHLLLLYRDPVMQIAESVAAEVEPADAVTQWQQQADAILAAYRRARRRITLMELSAALAEPNAMIRALNQRLGLSLANLADAGQTEPELERDPVHMLIADRALHQNASAHHAAAEMEASALPLAGNTGVATIDLLATCQSYREKCEHQKLKTQAESEQQSQPAQEELKEENELLLMQLHQVQEELESYFLENRDINKKFAELEKNNQALMHEAHELRDTVKALYSSISWKITAPLRAVLRPFKGK